MMFVACSFHISELLKTIIALFNLSFQTSRQLLIRTHPVRVVDKHIERQLLTLRPDQAVLCHVVLYRPTASAGHVTLHHFKIFSHRLIILLVIVWEFVSVILADSIEECQSSSAVSQQQMLCSHYDVLNYMNMRLVYMISLKQDLHLLDKKTQIRSSYVNEMVWRASLEIDGQIGIIWMRVWQLTKINNGNQNVMISQNIQYFNSIQDQYSGMSVYSGFATRQQQKRYNDYLESIIMILAQRLLKFYAGEECDQPKFNHLVFSIYEKMFAMEQSKYLQPHYSHLIRDMLNNIHKVYQSYNTLKYPQHYNHSFLDHQRPQPKISFDSAAKAQEKFDETVQNVFVHDDSQKTLHGSQSKIKGRLKTVGYEQAKPNFHTPEKRTFGLNQDQNENRRAQREGIFINQRKKQITMGSFKAHSMEKPIKTEEKKESGPKGSLSPRQFLRATIMGNKNINNFQALRMKQRHQKTVNY